MDIRKGLTARRADCHTVSDRKAGGLILIEDALDLRVPVLDLLPFEE